MGRINKEIVDNVHVDKSDYEQVELGIGNLIGQGPFGVHSCESRVSNSASRYIEANNK